MKTLKNLEDTVYAMTSDDYKERFKAEYSQLILRANKLNDIITKYYAGKLNFELKCDIELLIAQWSIMTEYVAILQKRAEIENIDLTILKTSPDDE